MRVERFMAADVARALEKIRKRLGDDALVLSTSSRAGGVEVLATTEDDVRRFERTLRAPVVTRPQMRRSRVIALIGPTGSGKSTTAAKLALSDAAFGGSRVGLITMDTYKIGAFDQIQTYADLADLPLELVSDPREVYGALSRLEDCDVVIIDTPGRAPGATAAERVWREAVVAAVPDEVHLVVSACIRVEIAEAVLGHFADLEPTHALLTKLDEDPGESGVAAVVSRLGLPTRWVTDGQLVPEDLHSAPERLMDAALGRRAEGRRLEAIA